MVVQQLLAILVFSQEKLNTCPTPPSYLCCQALGCRGPALVDPGNSKRGRRWREKNLFIDIRLRNNSVVGKLSGGRGLNNLDYAEDQ